MSDVYSDFFPRSFLCSSERDPQHIIVWPIIVITIAVFLVSTEYKSQDCSKQCDDKQLCIHSIPLSDPNDTEIETIDKMIKALRRHHTAVGWRRAMLVAIITGIIILMLMLGGKIVNGFTFFLIATMIFVVVYFSSVWLQSRWFTSNDMKIEESLLELRNKLKNNSDRTI